MNTKARVSITAYKSIMQMTERNPKLLVDKLRTLYRLYMDAMKEVTEYHARRTEADPKVWRVVELKKQDDEVLEVKELATGLKRNRAQALVKLLRSNQRHDSA